MAKSWSGSITLESGTRLDSLILTPPADHDQLIPEKATLRFLSVVEIARIPLHLSISPAYTITTTAQATQTWLQDILLSCHKDETQSWWTAARPESPLAVLLAIDIPTTITKVAIPPTEVLVYATRQLGALNPPTDGQPTITFGVSATILSSALLSRPTELTPPASPNPAETTVDAVFLPLPNLESFEIINEPPTRKRKTASEAFDQADERRRKARRAGGHSISAAAAAKTDPDAVPSLAHRRSTSAATNQTQARPLSRSPSISGSRPPTARGPSEAPKRSSLSHMQNVPDSAATSSLETKNKDLISRTVMACMRLHGLSQTRSRQSRAGKLPGSPTYRNDDAQESKRTDDEFKLIYHQVYKGVSFAFRQYMSTKSLQSWSNLLRETADRLLDIFCNDPMQDYGQKEIDEVTPGGRKAFASSSTAKARDGNIFLVPPIDAVGQSTSPTPNLANKAGHG